MSYNNGPKIVNDGLIVCVDANNTKSYPGSGTSAYNMVGSSNTFSFGGNLSWQSGTPSYFASDGTNDGLETPHSSNLNITGAYTLEVWIWWSQHKLYGCSLVKGPGGSGNYFNYCFFFYDTNIITGCGDGTNFYSTSLAVSSGYINTNSWHHLVGTFNGTNTFKIYVDGVERSSATMGSTIVPYQNTDILSIVQNSYSLNGRISSARVYNTCFTPDQVRQNYNASKSRFNFCTPYGTFLYQYCIATNLYQVYADGGCGTYTEILDCVPLVCPGICA